MVAQQLGPRWTVEQYLEMEGNSTVKHEYHAGTVYAVAGDTQDHSQIAVNVLALLRSGLRGTGCRVLNSDIKIRQTVEDYVYADVVVTCDPRDRAPHRDWIEHPSAVVEVLSWSTAQHDRSDKFEGYAQIASCREYLLVEYRRREVEVRRRGADGEWSVSAFGPGDTVTLTSLGLDLPMDLIYEEIGLR